ncbi:family 18 putative glycoside hydrolase [Cercophora samala]|uniref:chitinase n=1 Tax=Cercophora samala TaxID=330535 RepID=A0AA40D3F1_9PEZI|nr:family 18 putative glycoside hydrolase [Cercophora samala]
MLRPQKLLALCGLIFSLSHRALAGFDSSASNNIAVYWGQNSINRPTGGQQRLSYYCANSPINIIPLAFLYTFKSPATTINFSNAGDNCTAFPGSQLLSCPQMEEDIQTCQTAHNKSLLLSIGGATYSEGGFASAAEAVQFAGTVWEMFGPKNESSTVERPFGEAVVDGFDIDLEGLATNMVDFVRELRRLMDADGKKRYYLSGAPQCVFPDAAMGEMMNEVGFDFVMVQFYNNDCGVDQFTAGGGEQAKFNFERWDQWARDESKNTGVKVLLGLAGSQGAANRGYVDGDVLKGVVEYSKGFGSFGGAMMWDMSQVYGNVGFLDSIQAALGSDGQSSGQASSLPPSQTASQTTSQTASQTASLPSSQLSSQLSSLLSSLVSSQTSFITVTTTVVVSATATEFQTEGTPSTTSTSATSTSGAAIPTGTLVPHWGTCGGQFFYGSTLCEPPYQCFEFSEFFSQCL